MLINSLNPNMKCWDKYVVNLVLENVWDINVYKYLAQHFILQKKLGCKNPSNFIKMIWNREITIIAISKEITLITSFETHPSFQTSEEIKSLWYSLS